MKTDLTRLTDIQLEACAKILEDRQKSRAKKLGVVVKDVQPSWAPTVVADTPYGEVRLFDSKDEGQCAILGDIDLEVTCMGMEDEDEHDCIHETLSNDIGAVLGAGSEGEIARELAKFMKRYEDVFEMASVAKIQKD